MSQQRQKAFTELYNTYKNAIYGFILNRVNLRKDIAEELLGDVFVSAYQQFDETKKTHASWLYTIARNKIIDYSRKKKDFFYEQSDIDIISEESIHIIDEIDYLFIKEEINTMLDVLNEIQKQCITLFYLENFSSKEVAQKIGISDAAVRKHLSRSLKKIRESLILNPQYYEKA